jgi:hypothetical protein
MLAEGEADVEEGLRLELVGGPLDGEVVRLAHGEALGRWDPDATVACPLYRERPAEDPHLSRQHLRVVAAGAAALARVERLRRGRSERFERGATVPLAPGDLLRAGATWLRIT